MALALCSQAHANQYSFLLQNPVQVNEGPDDFASVDFSIYMDPNKTNWIAWSQAPATNEDDKGDSIVDAVVPNNYGIDDYMEVRLTDPQGRVSATYELDRNDANNISYGPQAFIYGKEDVTPSVVRTDAQGKPSFFKEKGVADEFMREGGKGYYNVSITFKNEFGEKRGTGDVYLLMDVEEDFIPEPPAFQNRIGSNALPYMDWGGSSSGARGSGFYPGENDNNNDGGSNGGGGGGSNPNTPVIPEVPIDPEPPNPVVPEPTTLALAALGLAGIAGRRLRRRAR
jgi:MYXO-CTERM domain-containing protein